MLEIPEVTTIARQMLAELRGKRITDGTCGASPHKFAFYNHPVEDYTALLQDRTVGDVTQAGNCIFTALEPEAADSRRILLLGDMGGRILFHRDATTFPQKHQLLLHFADGTSLTVTIQMWGFIQALTQTEAADRLRDIQRRISPISADFTFTNFEQLLADRTEGETKSVKFFMISKPGISGVGNGCLQDILFRAKIHPRRRVVDLTAQEQRALYAATRETLTQMVERGGRDTERDLYNQPGGYRSILDSRGARKPCPECGTPIEKISFLGGASYFCPKCQT